jgi:hypothetical protein
LDNYHRDNGEGLDCYKVGPTLGAGGIAPVVGGKLWYSKNWTGYKVLYTGPLQTVFELTYQPWDFNGIQISEIKRITLNAGSQLNRVEVTYNATGLDTIPVAVGIAKRSAKGIVAMNEQKGSLSYWEPENNENGTTGIGVIVPHNQGMGIVENHLAVFSKAANNKPFTYFQGACWDKAGTFTSEPEWTRYLKEFELKIQNPLVINYGNTEN